MKTLLRFALWIALIMVAATLRAQTNGWQPGPGLTQVPLWPGAVPDAQPVAGPETATASTGLIAGKPVLVVSNVAQPTMTLYSPKGTNTSVAIVVFPGGGYNVLAIDLEGTEVCEWLASEGITGVLLKYRVPGSGPHWDAQAKRRIVPKVLTALEDAQRTISLLRFHAAEWHIDPHKIGVLGFSAGGHLVAATSTGFEHRLYQAVDAADQESCRPDFGVALYPGHMLENTTNDFDLNPTLNVTSNTPPTFLAQNADDPVDTVTNSLVYYIALQRAGIPVEMHLYARGGHAFGLRPTKSPITGWPQLVEKWLHTIGMISD